MDKNSHLHVYGLGPGYVIIIIALTSIGILLNALGLSVMERFPC